MSTKTYLVNAGMNYPTDIKIISRIAAGEHVPSEARNEKRVEIGDLVNDIPAPLIPDLLKDNIISLHEDNSMMTQPKMIKKDNELNG